MASKRTAHKRKQTSNSTGRNKRRRRIQPAYTNASASERDYGRASETFWAARGILQDNGTHYLVEWDGIDSATGSPYEPTWEPHDFVTPALKTEWEEAMALRSAVARHTQAQSYGNAGDRARSPGECTEVPTLAQETTLVQSPVGRVLQNQSASPISPRRSWRDSSLLFEGSQESECKPEASDLRSCGAVLASQSKNGSASYTTTTSKEVSDSNRQNSATTNDPRDTDAEDLRVMDPAVLVLRDSCQPFPPASLESSDSVESMQQSPQLVPGEKIQEREGRESTVVESATQEKLELLEQAGHEREGTQSRIGEEDDLISPAPLANEEPSEVREQQKTYGGPKVQEHSRSGFASKAVYGQSMSSAEAELVFRTEIQKKINRQVAAVVLPSVETAEEQGQVLASLQQSPERHPQKREAGGEVIIRHALVSLDANKGFHELRSVPVRSEQPISPSLYQSEPAEQHNIECTRDLLVFSTNNKQMEHSATYTPSTMRLEQRISGQRNALTCTRTDVSPALRQSENGCCTTKHFVTSTNTNEGRSPGNPSQSTGSTLIEASQSRDKSATVPRSLLGPYASVNCSDSPNIIYQGQLQSIGLVQQHVLPSIDRPKPNRRWATWSYVSPYNDHRELQHRKSHPTESIHSSMTQIPGTHAPVCTMSRPNNVERADNTELMRAGLQLEPKKNKRRFVNRTKTGCLTCRQRKKKCNEAKPECNNCKRNGFICKGYANKAPWPKNEVAKPLPSLQAKNRIPTNAPQLYSRFQGRDLAHILNYEPSRGNAQTSYPDSYAYIDRVGDCDRPIAVGEQDHLPSAWSGNTGRSEPFRVLYPPAQQLLPASYSQPPLAPAPIHERDTSHNLRRVTHSVQGLSPLCHNPRAYDHTLQGISQITNNPSTAASEAQQQTGQPPQHPSLVTLSAATPGPPPSHHAPSLHVTEKKKMMDGEAFMPCDVQLVNERMQCAGAVYRFNTGSAAARVPQSIHELCLKEIVKARWAQPCHGASPVGCLGDGVHIATPFHCDYGYNISVGDDVIIGPNCQLLDSGRITIGRNTQIGACVTITTLETPTNTKALKGSNGTEVAKEVYIGENVYIGNGCHVGAGVRIGNGAVVRSGSVVVHDIPPNYIALGNP